MLFDVSIVMSKLQPGLAGTDKDSVKSAPLSILVLFKTENAPTVPKLHDAVCICAIAMLVISIMTNIALKIRYVFFIVFLLLMVNN